MSLVEISDLGDPPSMQSTPVPSNPSEEKPYSMNVPDPPPPHQPQSDEEPDRWRGQVASGLFIPYSESTTWLKKKHGVDLSGDPSRGLTVLANMLGEVIEYGYYGNFEVVSGQDPGRFDLLFVTQRIRGQFLNVEPAGEEVLQGGFKEIMKPGELEEEVHDVLLQVFG